MRLLQKMEGLLYRADVPSEFTAGYRLGGIKPRIALPNYVKGLISRRYPSVAPTRLQSKADKKGFSA